MVGPRIVTLIVSRERPTLLRRAVRSALRQTWSNQQILIIDDASGRATQDALKELESSNPRDVKVIRHRKRRGPSGAWWTVRPMFRDGGSHIALLADDDEWEPQKLERQMAALERIGEGLVCTNARIIDENHEPTGERFSDRHGTPTNDTAAGLFLEGSFVCASSVLLSPRATGLYFSHLPRLIQAVADAYLWTSVTTKYPLVYVDELLTRYRVWNQSLMATHSSRIEWEYCYSRRKLWSRFPQLEALISRDVKRHLITEMARHYAYTTASRGDFAATAGLIIEGFRENPSRAFLRRLLGQARRGAREYRAARATGNGGR